MAGPLGPMGGGMLRVVDYLIQKECDHECYRGTRMVKLDTRGTRSAAASSISLARTIGSIFRAHRAGTLAGVHVHMAERLSVLRKGLLLLSTRALGVPTVLHLHAAQMESYYQGLSYPSRRFTRMVFQLATHNVVLGSKSQEFLERTLRIAPERISVVTNGVPRPVGVTPKPRTPGKQRLIFLGNLWERKGVNDLLQALCAPGFDAERLEVLIIGGGDVDKYRQLSESLGLQALVQFAGWVTQAEATAYVASADALILPSYDEGLPLAVLEALAHGVPTISTPVGEIPSVLSHGVNTLFVQPGDVAGIGDTIRTLLQDEALRRNLAENGLKIFEERFSVEKFSAHIAAIHSRHFRLGDVQAAEQPESRIESEPLFKEMV